MYLELLRFYFSKVLNFGLRSAPALFDEFAQALLEFAWHEGATRRIVRYVDDFLIVAASAAECEQSLQVLLDTCHNTGFTVKPAKVTHPANMFLGIIIDAHRGELRISHNVSQRYWIC